MKPSNAYMRHYNIPILLQIMACCLRRVKPVSEPMLPYFKINPMEYISVKTYIKCKCSHSRKYRWKCRLLNCGHFFWASKCWYQSINIIFTYVIKSDLNVCCSMITIWSPFFLRWACGISWYPHTAAICQWSFTRQTTEDIWWRYSTKMIPTPTMTQHLDN